MKDDTREIASPWPFTHFPPSAGVTFGSTATMTAQPTFTFTDPNDRSDIGWYGVGAFAPQGEGITLPRDNGGDGGGGGGGGGGNGRKPLDDDDDDDDKDKKKSKKEKNKNSKNKKKKKEKKDKKEASKKGEEIKT